MEMMPSRPRLVVIAILLGACASDDAAAPAAPTDLMVSSLGAGAHLTWKDNSSDESEFVIMRKVSTDAAMAELARVPFNGTSYHDEPIATGTTYIYMIVATGEHGESESNQATFVAP
jgi:hypothetical protein